MQKSLKLLLLFTLLMTSFGAFAHDVCKDKQRPGRVYIDVYDYRGYIELEIINEKNHAVTCSGDVKWRYRNSSHEAYQGIYKYLQPGESYQKTIPTSQNLRLDHAWADINCR